MHTITLWAGRKLAPYIAAHAMVDDEHAIQLRQFEYRLSTNGYPFRSVGKNSVYLSQDILRLQGRTIQPGLCVSYDDRNPLNCCGNNLRITTRSAATANADARKNNTSGYHAVFVCSDRPGQWEASLTVNTKTVHLGRFHDPVDAARAVNRAYAIYWPDVKPPNDLTSNANSSST